MFKAEKLHILVSSLSAFLVLAISLVGFFHAVIPHQHPHTHTSEHTILGESLHASVRDETLAMLVADAPIVFFVLSSFGIVLLIVVSIANSPFFMYRNLKFAFARGTRRGTFAYRKFR